MATVRQELGVFGEQKVVQNCACPKCKRKKTLVRLPANFKCADVICDFCGYLAQVKASSVKDVALIPKTVLGAAWGPQKERMDAAIYFPLFLVLVSPTKKFAIYYLAADLQPPELFKKRAPLSQNARRAGWQGFTYETRHIADRFVRLI
ncbi:MAG: DpnI domain-containing protein [Alphaproteobacteria bacterium]